MTHAFALGYDWLHDVWTPEQRQILRAAMTDKGLNLARDAYRGSTRYGGWIRARHNWNQVCNGRIGMGALALPEEAPELAGEILHGALTSLQIPMAEFAPDGAWNEGPGYWNYATSYNVVFHAALESALGSDFGLPGIPGFGETGLFPLYVTGPLGQTFNYADGGAGTIRAPHLFWLSRRFQQPACATYQRKVALPQPLDLLWFQPAPERAIDLPRDKYFRAAEVVTMRSAWNEPDAVFVGILTKHSLLG